MIPRQYVKNRLQRLVVLNRIARSVVERQRGRHPDFVFSCQGEPIKKMNVSSWRNARRRTGIPVRIHDLKHTYGARLRAAPVPEEDRKELLGHKSGRSMTTHYSAPDISRLVEYAERVVPDQWSFTKVSQNEQWATGRTR
ncbi:MAG: tyrosine-type recombinase/integrase [Nitrospinae bacterium]|nr:tyrosine-type recombinase/integrase [Nitrospinota bacterium]